MKPLCLLSVFLPLLAAGVAVPVRADSELFPRTEVTARYEPFRWMAGAWRAWRGDADEPQTALMQAEALAAIEPAAGHGAEEAPAEAEGGHESAEGGHGSEGGEAKEGGHGAPSATGKSEGQKSFTGKVIGAPPPLPEVTIGGQKVISHAASIAGNIAASTPESFKKIPGMMDFLARRFNITPYAHSPQRGNLHGPITVIVFEDLSCNQCLPDMEKIDATLLAYASTTVVNYVHAPLVRFQDTNLPAFYGKVAARSGFFWQYRDNLIKNKPADANAIFDELVKSGVSVSDARMLMLNEARRFYRELDADALLARSFGVSKPPVVFVNGIRLGEAGIPLDKLKDVMDYVTGRINHNLPEPPK